MVSDKWRIQARSCRGIRRQPRLSMSARISRQLETILSANETIMNLVVELARKLPDPLLKVLLRLRLNPFLRPGFDWFAIRMKNQDSVIQRGAGKGLRFNPGGSNAAYLLGTAEQEVQDVLKLWLRPGMNVYDVGANVGFITVIAALLVGDSGNVCGFEPVPLLADQVVHNAGLNRFRQVSVHRVALSDQDGEAVFQVSENLTMGKLVNRESHEHEATDHLMVRKCKLDTLVAMGGLPDPDVVKIDVEGAEANVLDGAVEVLRRARPALLIELHSTNQAVADRLEEMSFVARLLGSPESIRAGPPNATVAAVPEERASMLEQIPTAWGFK
jgi:FkbM family methyltransferase